MVANAGQAGWTWAQTAVLLGAALAFLGAAVASTLNHALAQRAARRDRQVQAFAESLSAVESYAELPYRVLRRSSDDAARRELTEEISSIQSRIAFHRAWMRIETPQVAEAYERLVRTVRRQAGGQMRQAWDQKVRAKDHQMNLHVPFPRDEIDVEVDRCVRAMRVALGYKDLHRTDQRSGSLVDESPTRLNSPTSLPQADGGSSGIARFFKDLRVKRQRK